MIYPPDPTVSVVIPTCNRPGLIARAVGSALNQTVRSVEVIVVDDGPCDQTRAAVEAIGDSRVVYIRHEQNKGPSASRNTGIHAARGGFIAFLDDDDEWLPDKTERQLRHMQTNQLDAVAGIGLIDGKVPLKCRRTVVTPDDLRMGNRWGSCTLLARAEAVKDVMFDETLRIGEDWDFYIRMAEKYRIGSLTEPLFIYHQVGPEAASSRLLNAAKSLSPAELEMRTEVLRKHRMFFGEWWFKFHSATALLSHIGSRHDKARYIRYAIKRCGLTAVVAVLVDKVAWQCRALRWTEPMTKVVGMGIWRKQAMKAMSNSVSACEEQRAKRRILLVPGFVADTYSEIEQAYVELSAEAKVSDVEFVWLVPEIDWKYNHFKRPENKTTLSHPVCVPHLRRNGVTVIVANISKFNVVRNFVVFRRVFRQFDIDAVYTHFGFERFWATFFGKLFGKVTVWNEHWNSLGTRYVVLKRIFYRFFVDEFIAISDFIKATLPRSSRVHTVPNAVRGELSKRRSEIEKSTFRKQLGIPEEAKVVLMVAGFRPEKRHTLALEVCRRVLAKSPNTIFVFLGDGKTRAEFLEKVALLELTANMIAPGHVDNVDDYYAIADVCILTSYNDGFGYCVLEAMRHGVPMVSFDSGGPREIVRNGESGILVKDADTEEFAQQVIALIDNEPLRTRMGESARNIVQKEYGREAWIRKLNGILESIVIERRGSKPEDRLKGVVGRDVSY